MVQRSDLRSERLDMRSERPDLGTKKPVLRPGRGGGRSPETKENYPVWITRSSAPPGLLPNKKG